jgi:hypothetical protein
MNRASSERQPSEFIKDTSFVNAIGRAFLDAFGGKLEGMDRGERAEPCRQEDYDLLEHHRRARR